MTDARATLARSGYWLSQALQGRGEVRRRLAQLDTAQWASPEEIRARQLAKLQELVAWCWETVPYYREAIAAAGLEPGDVVDFDSYAALPLLTRDLLHERGADLVSRRADRGALHPRHSSGSTGQRIEVLQDRDFDLWCRAHQLRTYRWCGGWEVGDPFVLVWGSPVLFEGRSRSQRIGNRIARRTALPVFQLDRAAVDRTLDALATVQPRLITGYTTALYLLARRALERGVELPRLRAVQPTAEPLSAAMRATIAEGLDCEVFDKYGSRESSVVAHESPAHAGMCIQAEHVHVEFLDARGGACPPGKPGRLALTTLNNRAQPLLRYETTDVAAPLAGRCPSGVGLPLMTPVAGRLQDVLATPGGGLVHPQLLSNVMRQFPRVSWFQAVQEQDARLRLRIVAPDGPLPQEDRRTIAQQICQHAGFAYEIEFEHLADMPAATTETGKFRVCVAATDARGGTLTELNALRGGE